MEGPICEIACRRATDREIAGLRQLLDQMEQAEGDLAAFARLDSAFHAMVARLTRSSMMQQIYQIIDDAMQSAYRQNVRRQSVQVAVRWYKEMLAAFEARDSARARRAMEQALAQTFWISTVYQDVVNMETAWPDRVAVRCYDEAAGCVREIRYREYAADIRRMVGYLRRNVPGIRGRHIGLVARTGYSYAVAIFGCILAGAVAVPLNYEKSWQELSAELARRTWTACWPAAPTGSGNPALRGTAAWCWTSAPLPAAPSWPSCLNAPIRTLWPSSSLPPTPPAAARGSC